MQLSSYPIAIANLEESLLQANINIEIYSESLSFFDSDIEIAIFNAPELKNDQQRKAKRLFLQQTPDYLEKKRLLTEAKIQRERQSIELNQLRNEFSVAKLEARVQAANLEAVA